MNINPYHGMSLEDIVVFFINTTHLVKKLIGNSDGYHIDLNKIIKPFNIGAKNLP